MTENRLDKLVQSVTKIFNSQINLAKSQGAAEAGTHLLRKIPLGYIFGFTCAVLATNKIEKDEEKVSLVQQVYTTLFDEPGMDIFKESCDLNSKNPDFQKGSVQGWEELHESVKDGKVPLGLADILQKEEGQK